MLEAKPGPYAILTSLKTTTNAIYSVYQARQIDTDQGFKYCSNTLIKKNTQTSVSIRVVQCHVIQRFLFDLEKLVATCLPFFTC